MYFDGGKRELGETVGKVLSGLVDMVGRTIVKQVPDDLDSSLLGGLERGKPARPVVLSRRFFDEVPANSVAERPEAELAALAIVLEHMPVVGCCPDQVEAHSVAAAM